VNKQTDDIRKIKKQAVAVVDDEPDILELVTLHLERNGFAPVKFKDASELLEYLKTHKPELIILDLMLPDMDGFEVCKYLRARNEYAGIPIIMLTARDDEADKITGLEIGADDYITKPFSPRELIARIKAVLRRGRAIKDDALTIGDSLTIDILKFEVFSDGSKIELTTTEFKILRMLAERKGWVFSREQILDNLGVNDKGVLDRTVDVHIKNLREKLGDSGKYIKNVRGIGYKLEI
jgi:two-component system phosphate regulon response regulator PhoB/two-component system alkaline phosphatase synthesis response regulator PhoP